MALNIPGGEFLTGSLDVISQSLTIPVLVILLVIALLGGAMFGSLGQYTVRLFNRIPDFAK
jgi:flagellar biosynthesis protein FliQ